MDHSRLGVSWVWLKLSTAFKAGCRFYEKQLLWSKSLFPPGPSLLFLYRSLSVSRLANLCPGSSLFHYLQQASASITRRARVYQRRTTFLRGYPRGLTCFQRYPKCSSNNPSFRFNLFHTSSHTPVYSIYIYIYIYFSRTVRRSRRGPADTRGQHFKITRSRALHACVGRVSKVILPAILTRNTSDARDQTSPLYPRLFIRRDAHSVQNCTQITRTRGNEPISVKGFSVSLFSSHVYGNFLLFI